MRLFTTNFMPSEVRSDFTASMSVELSRVRKSISTGAFSSAFLISSLLSSKSRNGLISARALVSSSSEIPEIKARNSFKYAVRVLLSPNEVISSR